jgi:hypothetical protein
MLVSSSLVLSSRSDPPLSSDEMLIKWRPMTESAIGSWEDRMVLPGGRLLSWLVSMRSEEIMGFIVEGIPVAMPQFSHSLTSLSLRLPNQIPTPQAI